MASAKDIHVAPISPQAAADLVKRLHYSGKAVRNSQLHLGVYIDGRINGVMQFGPSLDKRNLIGLVRDTGWNGFIELNRMAFGPLLPRNSESRALGVAMRLIRKEYPQIEWVVSFADGCQCGDGTIYRASGFVLTAIRKNSSIWQAPSGEIFTDIGLRTGSVQRGKALALVAKAAEKLGQRAQFDGGSSMKRYRDAGFKPLIGYQLRYLFFINPAARERLTVPILPFSRIAELGAGMYCGEKVQRTKEQAAEFPSALGGAIPTRALQT